MLRDAARLAGRDIACPQRISNGLAVIDMAHNRDHRQSRHHIFAAVVLARDTDFNIR